MQCIRILASLCICALISGCHRSWHPGDTPDARIISYEDFNTIYYKMSVDHSNACLFFSQPKQLIVVSAVAYSEDTNTVKYGILFLGLSDTMVHRLQWDTASLIGATRTNGLWMMQFHLGNRLQGEQKREFGLYYESDAKDPFGIPIPNQTTGKN